jgi:hypothetical protein
MKLRRIWPTVAVAIGICLVAVILHDAVFPKGTIWQDRRSQRVVLRENQVLLARQEKMLYAGIGYEEKSAVWQRGAKIAYETPLEVGGVAALEDSRGHRYLFRLTDLDTDRRTATFDIADPAARVKHHAELPENMPIAFAPYVNVPWSFHTNSQVFLYADKYLEKPVSQLYRIAFLRSTDLSTDWSTDLAALPADRFQLVP